MPYLSVIVPSYNRKEVLEQTLRALGCQSLPTLSFEVVAVDDGSTDGSDELLHGLDALFDLSVIHQQNQGPGAARNRGAAEARGACFVFLDADVVPAPGLLEAYGRTLAQHPHTLVIGRQRPSEYKPAALYEEILNYERQWDLGPTPLEPAFYHVTSGNLAIGRETFERLGGFDVTLKMTEDTDLGYRAFRAGVPLIYCPDAWGFHTHPKTLEERCRNIYESARWTARLLKKHPEMRGDLPIYRDIEPVDRKADGLSLMIRKLGRRGLGLPPARRALEWAVGFLEKRHPRSRALPSLYWKVLSAHRVAGFRCGWRE